MAILEYLEGNESHPSASDIYKSVFDKFPTMSFATVYNTLETLKEKGVIKELSIDPDKKRFDPNTSPHHHLLCLRCKAIKDIFKEFPLALNESEKHDFDIIGHHVDFYGICPRCKGIESDKQK